MKKINKTVVLIFIFLCFFLFLKFRRENWKWTENIMMLNGETIEVHHHYSRRAIYGPPHMSFGGGGEKYKVWFFFKEKKYSWNTLYTPIIIQYWHDAFYIAMFDRENYSDLKIRFFKYEDILKEISSSNFPRQLAIQNRWVRRVRYYLRDDMPIEKYAIDPNDRQFRDSFTADIWIILEKKKKLNDIIYKEIEINFLIEYKMKYIDPIWGEKLNEKNK